MCRCTARMLIVTLRVRQQALLQHSCCRPSVTHVPNAPTSSAFCTRCSSVLFGPRGPLSPCSQCASVPPVMISLTSQHVRSDSCRQQQAAANNTRSPPQERGATAARLPQAPLLLLCSPGRQWPDVGLPPTLQCRSPRPRPPQAQLRRRAPHWGGAGLQGPQSPARS